MTPVQATIARHIAQDILHLCPVSMPPLDQPLLPEHCESIGTISEPVERLQC
jgi:hypothetical protein